MFRLSQSTIQKSLQVLTLAFIIDIFFIFTFCAWPIIIDSIVMIALADLGDAIFRSFHYPICRCKLAHHTLFTAFSTRSPILNFSILAYLFAFPFPARIQHHYFAWLQISLFSLLILPFQ